MDKILHLNPEDSPLAKLASKGSAPDWMSDELTPYTKATLLRDLLLLDLYRLAELEANE